MGTKKKKLQGYEFLAEALEESIDIGYLDTAAQAYYYGGKKKKAIELYEMRILPTARAGACKNCEAFYKQMVGLNSSQKIPYYQLYKKKKKKEESSLKKTRDEKLLNDYVNWGILAVLILILLLNTLIFLNSKAANKKINSDHK